MLSQSIDRTSTASRPPATPQVWARELLHELRNVLATMKFANDALARARSDDAAFQCAHAVMTQQLEQFQQTLIQAGHTRPA